MFIFFPSSFFSLYLSSLSLIVILTLLFQVSYFGFVRLGGKRGVRSAENEDCGNTGKKCSKASFSPSMDV